MPNTTAVFVHVNGIDRAREPRRNRQTITNFMRLLLERHGHVTTASTTVLPVDNRIRKGFRARFRARVMNFTLRQLTEQLMDDGR